MGHRRELGIPLRRSVRRGSQSVRATSIPRPTHLFVDHHSALGKLQKRPDTSALGMQRDMYFGADESLVEKKSNKHQEEQEEAL
jgi:hypothetical protein